MGASNSTSKALFGDPNPIACVGAPLGGELPQATRDKIGRGEFVDLSSLLENWSGQKDPEPLQFAVDDSGRPIFRQGKPPPP